MLVFSSIFQASIQVLLRQLIYVGHVQAEHFRLEKPVLFRKYLSPQKLQRNGSIFKICVWITVFRRKKLFENPIHGCRDIKQKPSLNFFVTLVNISLL